MYIDTHLQKKYEKMIPKLRYGMTDQVIMEIIMRKLESMGAADKAFPNRGETKIVDEETFYSTGEKWIRI